MGKKSNIKPVEDIEPATAESTSTEPADTETKIVESPESINEAEQIPAETIEHLDKDEEELNKLRLDRPGVKGASAAGIVAISVAKAPRKNEFFRTHKTFRFIVNLVDHEVGMEKQFFAVTPDMVAPLAAIGVTVSAYTLYLTVTAGGAYRVVPVRRGDDDGEQNEYHRTKEFGLLEGMEVWVRLYTDLENKCYKVFQAPEGRYGEPQWPELTNGKIFRLSFRDKGRLIDSTEHPLFQKWAGRDNK